MARYRKIDPRIWNDEKFRLLGDDGQIVFFFLLTHPNQTALGAMRATMPGLAAEKGWALKRFQGPFEQIQANGMAVYDDGAACVWLPNFVRYNDPESPNVVKSWVRALDFIPECAVRRRAIVQAGHAVRVLADKKEGFKKAFAEAFPEEYCEAFAEGLREGLREGLPEGPRQPIDKALGNKELRAKSRDLGRLPRGIATGSKSATGADA